MGKNNTQKQRNRRAQKARQLCERWTNSTRQHGGHFSNSKESFYFLYHLDQHLQKDRPTEITLKYFEENLKNLSNNSKGVDNHHTYSLALYKALAHLSHPGKGIPQELVMGMHDAINRKFGQWQRGLTNIYEEMDILHCMFALDIHNTLAQPIPRDFKPKLQALRGEMNNDTPDHKSMIARNLAIQFSLTNDPFFKETAYPYYADIISSLENMEPMENEGNIKRRLIQICKTFNWDCPFNALEFSQKNYDDTVSRAEKRLQEKISQSFGESVVIASPLISPHFPHIADLEIKTGDLDTRFVIEVDGYYHHIGYDLGGMPLCNGSTILQSHLIQKTLQDETQGSVLLRISTDAVDELSKLSSEKFTEELTKIMANSIQNLPETSIAHYRHGHFFVQPLSYQYDNFRVAAPLDQYDAPQEYAYENEALLAPH